VVAASPAPTPTPAPAPENGEIVAPCSEGQVIVFESNRFTCREPDTSCALQRIPQGASWHDATAAQVAAARKIVGNPTYVPTRPMYVYWHVATDGVGNRSKHVIQRQWDLMSKSGLLSNIKELRIGVTGVAPLVLNAWLRTRIVAQASTFDTYGTLHTLWRDACQGLWNDTADATASRLVLYISTRGVFMSLDGSPTDDYVQLLENRLITRWRMATALLDTDDAGVLTAGCDRELAPNMTCNNVSGWIYPLNFWWARSEHIRSLADPSATAIGSEYWLMGSLPTNNTDGVHFSLLSTGPQLYHFGSLAPYLDAIPPYMYNCSHEVNLPSRSLCAPLDLTTCHGHCCSQAVNASEQLRLSTLELN
jgi:hypothetical protein